MKEKDSHFAHYAHTAGTLGSVFYFPYSLSLRKLLTVFIDWLQKSTYLVKFESSIRLPTLFWAKFNLFPKSNQNLSVENKVLSEKVSTNQQDNVFIHILVAYKSLFL